MSRASSSPLTKGLAGLSHRKIKHRWIHKRGGSRNKKSRIRRQIDRSTRWPRPVGRRLRILLLFLLLLRSLTHESPFPDVNEVFIYAPAMPQSTFLSFTSNPTRTLLLKVISTNPHWTRLPVVIGKSPSWLKSPSLSPFSPLCNGHTTKTQTH
jgi:hypothetical protein